MKVTNRSTSAVGYELEELKVRRNFAPNETKDIPTKELETLYQQDGGYNLLRDYLMVSDKPWMEKHFAGAPIEYFWTVDDIKKSLFEDSKELFEETLDYAPEGVLDIIKDLAWRLPISDMNKVAAIRDKLGFDVLAAIEHMKPKTAPPSEATVEAPKPKPHTTSRLRKG